MFICGMVLRCAGPVIKTRLVCGPVPADRIVSKCRNEILPCTYIVLYPPMNSKKITNVSIYSKRRFLIVLLHTVIVWMKMIYMYTSILTFSLYVAILLSYLVDIRLHLKIHRHLVNIPFIPTFQENTQLVHHQRTYLYVQPCFCKNDHVYIHMYIYTYLYTCVCGHDSHVNICFFSLRFTFGDKTYLTS